jgi:hypothetical protein
MAEANKQYSSLTLEEIVADFVTRGISWSYCGNCHPESHAAALLAIFREE